MYLFLLINTNNILQPLTRRSGMHLFDLYTHSPSIQYLIFCLHWLRWDRVNTQGAPPCPGQGEVKRAGGRGDDFSPVPARRGAVIGVIGLAPGEALPHPGGAPQCRGQTLQPSSLSERLAGEHYDDVGLVHGRSKGSELLLEQFPARVLQALGVQTSNGSDPWPSWPYYLLLHTPLILFSLQGKYDTIWENVDVASPCWVTQHPQAFLGIYPRCLFALNSSGYSLEAKGIKRCISVH